MSNENSVLIHNLKELHDLERIVYPVDIRPAFTLRDSGHAIAFDRFALDTMVVAGLQVSPTSEVLLTMDYTLFSNHPSSLIKRYKSDIEPEEYGAIHSMQPCMTEDINGEWVKYEDHLNELNNCKKET